MLPNEGAQVLDEVRSRFESFAMLNDLDSLWRDINAGAEPGLAADAWQPNTATILATPQALARELGRLTSRAAAQPGSDVLALDTAAEAVWAFAGTLSPLERSAFEVLLVRGVRPERALGSWPDDVVFSHRELETIASLEGDGPAPSPGVRPEVESGPWIADYGGYVCAIVKITRLCNLRCVYCHDWRAGPGQKMSFPIQARLMRNLLQSDCHKLVDFVWHGGEPTSVGRRTFLRLLALQDRYRRPAQAIRNRLQTNGVNLDSEWLSFLRRYNFRVSVSIDGPQEAHDTVRVDARGQPTWHEVITNIRTLADAGLLQQVLMVATPQLVALGAARIMEFLREERLLNVGILAMRPAAGRKIRPAEALSVTTYVDFLLAVHEQRLSHPEPWIAVREIDEPLRALRGEPVGHCELLGGCVGTFLSIDPDGSISHCDKFVGDDDYVLGNVLVDDFESIQVGGRTTMLELTNRSAAERWRQACPYFTACHGWCPHERYVAEKQLHAGSTSCCGLRGLFEGLHQAELRG